jgi:IS5 family transposase
MNNGKKGRPYTYPDSLYYFLLNIKCIFKIDYRTIQGISRRLFVLLDLPGTTPDYTTIQRRLKSLKPALQVPVVSGEQEIAGDSSGLKTSNRGEYRMSKYKDGKRKRFVKVHLAVNIKTRQVVSVNVTDDAVSDSSRLRNLVRDSEKFGKVKRALFDKAYDGQENYWFLKTVGIDAGIKPRESLPRLRLAKEIRRLQAVLGECPDDQEIQKKLYRWRQLKQCYDNEKYWIRKHKYGERWKVEGRYSVFKRLFGDFVYSRVSENIQNEVLLKINLMNRFTAMLAPNWS